MRLRSGAWLHVLAQLAGLMMLAVAIALVHGFAYGLGLAGVGILAVGVAAERAQLTREATHAG